MQRSWTIALAAALSICVQRAMAQLSVAGSPTRPLGDMPQHDNQYSSWSIAADNDHNWLAAVTDVDPVDVGFGGRARVLVTRSFDRGRTWCEPQSIAQATVTHPRYYSGTCVHYLGGGEWAITWLSVIPNQPDSERTLISHSFDGGVTWTVSATFDRRQFGEEGRERSRRIRTANGTWITAYEVSWAAPSLQMTVARSDDEGQTWSEPISVFDNYVDFPNEDIRFSDLVTDGAGTWMIAWIRSVNSSSTPDSVLAIAFSEDDGRTWRSETVTPSDGERTISYDPAPLAAGSGVWILSDTSSVRRSTDNGRTWTDVSASTVPSRWLVRGNGDRIYALGTSTGLPNCSDAGGCFFDAFSDDAGITWSAPEVLLNTNALSNVDTFVFDGQCGWLLAGLTNSHDDLFVQRIEGPVCPPPANENGNHPCPQPLPQNDNDTGNRNDNTAGNENQNAVPPNHNAANANAGSNDNQAGNDNSPVGAACPLASTAILLPLFHYVVATRRRGRA